MNILRQGGYVKRFHTVPTIGDQSVGEHSFQLCLILLSLTNGEASANLLKSALYHDLPEVETGDIPATIKWRHPTLDYTLKELELKFITLYGLSVELTAQEVILLKFADMLELIQYCLDQLAMGNMNMYPIAMRGIQYLSKMGEVSMNCTEALRDVTNRLRRYENE